MFSDYAAQWLGSSPVPFGMFVFFAVFAIILIVSTWMNRSGQRRSKRGARTDRDEYTGRRI